MNIKDISYNCCAVELSEIRLNVKKGSRKKDKNSLMVVLAKFSELITTLELGLLLFAIRIFTKPNNKMSIDNETTNMHKNKLSLSLSMFRITNIRNKGN